jgi:hypothetical protein
VTATNLDIRLGQYLDLTPQTPSSGLIHSAVQYPVLRYCTAVRRKTRSIPKNPASSRPQNLLMPAFADHWFLVRKSPQKAARLPRPTQQPQTSNKEPKFRMPAFSLPPPRYLSHPNSGADWSAAFGGTDRTLPTVPKYEFSPLIDFATVKLARTAQN